MGYDDHNRLTSYGSCRSYTYDAWNNLLSVSSSNGVGEAPNYTLTYATNASGAPATNRINNSGYTYDNAGNVTNDGSLAYAYDAAGRLKTAGTNNSCEYDGDGRKVKQVSGGYPLFYLWSSVLGEPVVELDGSGGVYRAYVLSSGGQTIAVQSYDGGFYWLHTDHLGNGRKLTNSSGTVIYRAEFDPHGQMLYEWQSSGQTYLNSHKFTGYERDWATNLNYAKARTYQHNRARFLQPDPLGLGAADATNPQSLNLYSYVHNDPANFIDPSGLLCLQIEFTCVDAGDGRKVCGYDFHWTNDCSSTKAGNQGGGGGGPDGIGGRGGGGGKTNKEPKPCPPTGRTSIWNGSVTTNKLTIEAGAAIGGVTGGLPGALIGAAVGSMFGVGANVSYVPSTKSIYAGPTVVFAPGFIGGGDGYSFSRLSVPSSQNPNSVASGWGLTATFQPLPFAGSTVLKSPGNGPAVIGPSVGSRAPVSFGAGYNFTLREGGC